MPKTKYKKITSRHHFFDFELAEVWRGRQLLATLVIRDLQVRYKNTFLGVTWVVLQPVLATVIFTLIFANIFKFATSGDNYLVYTFIGFIFWQFFSNSVLQASTSIYEQINIVRKIYFPRFFLPLTIVIRGLFDFTIVALILLLVMFYYHLNITLISILGFLMAVLVVMIFTSGVSFIFSILNARYRDFRHLISFVVQIWFYITPVFYDISLLQGKLSFLITANPMTQLLIFVREVIFYHTIAWPRFLILLGVSLGILILGMGIFKNLETEMVDCT
jgi:lipopolysaccharide transport system permease protein